ncbi:MAG: hypothetical protein FWD65_05330, partial [Coriobacteriia bacterium]|nr:hypothetical protein [Coriobacteriia bacterium]
MIAIGAPLCAGAIVVTAMLMSHPALTATVSGGTQDFVYSTPNTTATNDYGGFATNTTYTIADQHDAFVYKDGRFDINPSGNPNQTFLAYCMRKELTAPPNGDTYTLDRNGSAGKRDNMASALALALASPDYGAKLSLEEFQQLFGYYPDGSFTGLGTGTDACTSEMRLILMNCFVWAYEDAVANNSPAFNPANPSTWHYVTDMNDWGDNLNSLSTTILTKDYLTTGLIKRIPPDYYPQIATRLLQMANQYYIANPSSSDPVSVLDITASFDTNTGQLSVGRSGYYPSVGDLPDGDTSYDLLLSCTGPSDIAIYVGGLDASNKVAGTTDIPIKPGDLIYIFGSGTVNMSVREQTRLSLVNGSIRGDILLNSSQESENYQPIITGYAKFGYPCRSLQIPCFPRKDINIPLRKTIAGDRPAGSFTFDFSVVMTDSNGAALTGAQAYSTTVSVPMDFTQTISQDFNVPLVLNQGTYYFKITETGYDTGSEWTSDTAPRYVRVTVNSGATPTTYEYRTNLADPWVTSTDATSAYRNFTNSYVKTTADATITYTKQVLGNPAGTSTTFSYRGIQLDASGNATGNWISLNSLTAPNNGTIVSTTATVRGFNKGVSYFLIEETGTEPSGWIYDRYRVAKVTVIDDTSTPLPGGLYALKVDSVDFVQYDLSSVKITDYTIDAKYTSGGFYPGNKTLTNNAFKNQCLSTTITYQKQVLGNPPGSSNYFPFKAIKIDASGAATGTWFNLPDAYGYTSGYGWGLTGLYNGTIGAYSKATISLSQLTLGDNYFLIAEQGTAPAGWIYDRYRVIEITTVVDTTQPSYALKLSTTPQYVEFDLSTVDIPGYTISTADLAPYQSGKTPAGDNTFKNQYVGIPYQKQVLGNPPGNYSYYPFRAIKIDASGASVGSWYNLPDGYGATSGSGWGLTGNFNGAITTYSKSSFPATDLVAGDNYFLIEELGTPPTGWIYDRYRVVKVTAQPGTDRPFDVTASYVEFDLNSVSIAGVALNDADIALYKEGKTPAGDDTFKNQYVGIPYQKQVLG